MEDFNHEMIKNITKGFVIAKQKKDCKSMLSKLIGLMFSRRIHDMGLIFHFKSEQINPIHMFFVFQSIDLLYLNKDKRVVEIARNVKPFSWYTPKIPSKYFIEIPKGKAFTTQIGDVINF